MPTDSQENIINGKDEKQERHPKNIMRPRSFGGERREAPEFEERVIEVARISRTVAGGRRIRFRALVVIGNKKGKVGMGVAKANDVTEAVRKAVTKAKKHLVIVPIIDGTIPYEMTEKYGSAVVMLKPAAAGTSIVAGGSVRAVAELAGITDLLGKMLGSASKINNILATMKALSSFDEKYANQIRKFSERKQSFAAKPVVEKAETKPTENETKKEPVKKPAKKSAK